MWGDGEEKEFKAYRDFEARWFSKWEIWIWKGENKEFSFDMLRVICQEVLGEIKGLGETTKEGVLRL